MNKLTCTMIFNIVLFSILIYIFRKNFMTIYALFISCLSIGLIILQIMQYQLEKKQNEVINNGRELISIMEKNIKEKN